MKCPKMKWTKEDTEDTFGADAIRAYYAEFAGMVFFLGISVGTAVGAFKTVSGYSNSFLKGAGYQEAANDEGSSGFTAASDNAMTMVIAFAFGMSIMVLAYSIGHISGGHFNPAVTLACCVFGKINPVKAICYIISQTLGATLGVALVKALMWKKYGEGIHYGLNAPAPSVQDWQAVLMEIFGTALLTYVVFGVAIDPKATPLVNHMAPLAIGFTVFLAHMMLVPVDGCGINPARSTASSIVSGYYNKLWIYWVGPMIGGPFGAAIHYMPLQWGDEPDKSEDKQMAMDGAPNADNDNEVQLANDIPSDGMGDKK